MGISMPRVWSLQSSFNRGELDPRLVGRKDIAAYYAGAKQATNVTTLVQGGIRRRNGTEYIDDGTDGRIFNFSFSTEVNYCLLFTDLNVAVYKDGVFQVNVVSPYTLAQVKDLDYIQSADTALIFHPEVAPYQLSRTSDVNWTFSLVSFENIPQFDFNDASSPTPVSEVQDIVFTNATEGDRFKLSLEGFLTDEIVFSSSVSANRLNIERALLDLPNTAGDGTITVGAPATTTFRVTFSGASAKNWELIAGTPIFSQNAAFQITASQVAAGSPQTENAWSNTRGWPSVATFHEGRLWVGGTTFRPSTVWGSKVNFFFDFGVGKARDDEGIDVTLDTDQVNALTGLFSNRTLQVFTTGGEFAVQTSPITPENIAISPQTNYGTKKVRPVTVDGLTLYVQRTGKALRNFFFVDETKAYASSSVSVLASQLVKNPIALAASRGTSEVDANYVYIVNDDGTMAVYNTLIDEDVNGFTDWVTDGEIISIAVVDDTLYTYVKRTILGVEVYYLERENTAYTTDSTVAATNTDTLTGLSHLEGETIEVIADGAYQGQFLVVGGQVTIGRQATELFGGLNFVPVVETMPLNVSLDNGPNAALPKRIVRASLELFNSNGILVNGERLADKTFGVNVFDPPEPQSRLEEIYLQGWDVESTLTITQEEPVPMTVLAAYLEVAV